MGAVEVLLLEQSFNSFLLVIHSHQMSHLCNFEPFQTYIHILRTLTTRSIFLILFSEFLVSQNASARGVCDLRSFGVHPCSILRDVLHYRWRSWCMRLQIR